MNPFDHQDEHPEEGFTFEDGLPIDAVPIIQGGPGQYLPQEFAGAFPAGEGFTADQRDILLRGPFTPDYWPTWEAVLNDCVIWVYPSKGVGKRYKLFLFTADNSLYLVPERRKITTIPSPPPLPQPDKELLEDHYAFTYADKLRLEFIKRLLQTGRISDGVTNEK